MCFAATCRDNAAAEDFRDDLSGITGTVHAIVRELIRGKALRMESAEAGFIAKERAAGHGHAAREEKFDRRIEPENRNSGGSQKFGATGLGVRAAAESEDCGFLVLGGAAESGAELIRFDLAKSRFAEAFEKLWNSESRGLLDAVVEVNETPRKLPREERANGCFAGTHEACEAKYLDAR